MKHVKTSKHDKWNKKKHNTLTSNIHLNNTDQIILTTWQHHIKKGLSNLLKANLNSVLRRPRNFVNITEDIGERVCFQIATMIFYIYSGYICIE